MIIENKIKNGRIISNADIPKFIREKNVKEEDIFNYDSIKKLVINVEYSEKNIITAIASIIGEGGSKEIIKVIYSLENENSVCARPEVDEDSDNNFKKYFNKLKERGLLK